MGTSETGFLPGPDLEALCPAPHPRGQHLSSEGRRQGEAGRSRRPPCACDKGPAEFLQEFKRGEGERRKKRRGAEGTPKCL